MKEKLEILDNKKKEDFYCQLSKDEKEGIEIGLKQVKEGKTIPYEKIIRKHRQ